MQAAFVILRLMQSTTKRQPKKSIDNINDSNCVETQKRKSLCMCIASQQAWSNLA